MIFKENDENTLNKNNDFDDKPKKSLFHVKSKHENEPFTKLLSREDVDYLRVPF